MANCNVAFWSSTTAKRGKPTLIQISGYIHNHTIHVPKRILASWAETSNFQQNQANLQVERIQGTPVSLVNVSFWHVALTGQMLSRQELEGLFKATRETDQR